MGGAAPGGLLVIWLSGTKALCGLKQALRAWHCLHHSQLLQHGFRVSPVDPCYMAGARLNILLCILNFAFDGDTLAGRKHPILLHLRNVLLSLDGWV